MATNRPHASLGDSPPGGEAALPAARRWAVRGVLTLAVVTAIVGSLAVWLNRQVLNAEHWSSTSTALLENERIREALSRYLVDQVYASVDGEQQLRDNVPDVLDSLVGRASGRLRDAGTDGVESLLGQPALQDAWRAANRVAMQQLINVVDQNDDGVISASPGRVAINVRPMVSAAAERLGLPSTIADRIPDDAGRFTVLASDEVSTVQRYGSALRGLALGLPLVAVSLFALAVWLAKGRRRRALLVVGLDVIAIGLFIVAARLIITNQGASTLAANDDVRPAVEAALSISTRMLSEIGWTIVLAGVPLALAAVTAGPAPAAIAIRRRTAPWPRSHPTAAARGLIAIAGAVLLWTLTAHTAGPLPLAVVCALAAFRLTILGRRERRRRVAPPA